MINKKDEKKKKIAEIDDNFTLSLGVMTSMIIYLDVYTKEAIKKEVEYRVNLLVSDITSNDIVTDVMSHIDYYRDQMSKAYGIDNNFLYIRENVEYLMSADTYRGVCYINSLKSYEYENMSSKAFKRRAKDIVQKMAVHFKNYKLTEKEREQIANLETKYLKKYNTLKYKENKVSYIAFIQSMKQKENQRILQSQARALQPNIRTEIDLDFEKKLKQSKIDEGNDFWASIGIDPDKKSSTINNKDSNAKLTFFQKIFNLFK